MLPLGMHEMVDGKSDRSEDSSYAFLTTLVGALRGASNERVGAIAKGITGARNKRKKNIALDVYYYSA